MKRSRLLLFLLLGVVLAAGVWYAVDYSATPATLIEKALNLAGKSGLTSFDGSKLQTNATEANPLEEVVGLAIKNINLFQGNKGVELWRLKASWAHLSQNGDTIDVDSPKIRYALGESSVSDPLSDILMVESDKGRITDNQRFLTLWENVVVTRFEDVLTGPRMNYDGTTRTMVFPEGAALDSPTASGTAEVFTWDLAKNELYGTNGVLVVLKPRQSPEKTSATPTASGGASGVTSGVVPGVAAGVVPASKPAQVQTVVPVKRSGKASTPTVRKTETRKATSTKAPRKTTSANRMSTSKKTTEKKAGPAKTKTAPTKTSASKKTTKP